MAFDEQLANRIRDYVADLPNIEEKKMMGGIVFMYNDKMCIGVTRDDLMCRIDPSMQDELVEKQGCRAMDMKGVHMNGFVLIDETGRRSNKDFSYWMDLAIAWNKHAKSSKKNAKSAPKKETKSDSKKKTKSAPKKKTKSAVKKKK
jgi:TfoX/Sxy family transcriptional regulator of competence genes